MMSRSSSERRSHPRVPLHRPAVVFVGDDRLPAQALDVSETGIGVALPGAGAAGTFVRVNFNVEETNAGTVPWLDVDGVVVRTHAHAGRFVWGIRFLSAPPGVVAGIKSHLAASQGAPVPAAATPRATSSTAIPRASSSTAIPRASSSTAIPRATSSTAIPKVASPAETPKAASPAQLPRAVAAPRVSSRQANDLRELYRSALEQVNVERQRAKKR